MKKLLIPLLIVVALFATACNGDLDDASEYQPVNMSILGVQKPSNCGSGATAPALKSNHGVEQKPNSDDWTKVELRFKNVGLRQGYDVWAEVSLVSVWYNTITTDYEVIPYSGPQSFKLTKTNPTCNLEYVQDVWFVSESYNTPTGQGWELTAYEHTIKLKRGDGVLWDGGTCEYHDPDTSNNQYVCVGIPADHNN